MLARIRSLPKRLIRFSCSFFMRSFSIGLSRFAKVVVIATLILIFLGGMVSSHRSGASAPGWPTPEDSTFTLSSSEKTVLLFWGHIHQLVLALVILLTGILAAWVWRKDSRKWVRWLGVVAVGLVVIHGAMGGLRQTHFSIALAIIDVCFAQAFPCVVTLLAMAVSPHWEVGRTRPPPRGTAHRLMSLAFWAWVLTGTIYLQLILAAVLRHLYTSLIVPAFPLVPEGALMPHHNTMFDLLLAHRFSSMVVLVIAVVVIGRSVGLVRAGFHPELFEKYAGTLIFLLTIQLFLRAWLVWFLHLPLVTSLHLVNGALLLMSAFAFGVRAYRFRRCL